MAESPLPADSGTVPSALRRSTIIECRWGHHPLRKPTCPTHQAKLWRGFGTLLPPCLALVSTCPAYVWSDRHVQVRAREDKRACCFEIHGYANQAQDGEVETFFLEATSRVDMFEWVLAIRRELAATELEPLPAAVSGLCPVCGLVVRHYSPEHRELLCDNCATAGRTPNGFAVIQEELQPLEMAKEQAASRLDRVTDSSYGLREIMVQTGKSIVASEIDAKERDAATRVTIEKEFAVLRSAADHRQKLLQSAVRTAQRLREDAATRKLTRLENVISEMDHQLAISEHIIGAAASVASEHSGGGSDADDIGPTTTLLLHEKHLTSVLEKFAGGGVASKTTSDLSAPVELAQAAQSLCASAKEALNR